MYIYNNNSSDYSTPGTVAQKKRLYEYTLKSLFVDNACYNVPQVSAKQHSNVCVSRLCSKQRHSIL